MENCGTGMRDECPQESETHLDKKTKTKTKFQGNIQTFKQQGHSV